MSTLEDIGGGISDVEDDTEQEGGDGGVLVLEFQTQEDGAWKEAVLGLGVRV